MISEKYTFYAVGFIKYVIMDWFIQIMLSRLIGDMIVRLEYIMQSLTNNKQSKTAQICPKEKFSFSEWMLLNEGNLVAYTFFLDL